MSEKNWQCYLDTKDAWQAMLDDIERAKKYIDFEQYAFVGDEIGRRFIDLLTIKAQNGVRVRMLIDAVGGYGFYNSSQAREMMSKGVEIRFYNPIKPWRLHNFTSWFFRNHRKLLIIDGELAYTGGVGIEKIMQNWRDTEVRITGKSVFEAQYIFDRMWQIVGDAKFRRFRLDKRPENEFRFLTNSPHFRQRFFYRRLRASIRRAKKYVYLTTPYFIPSQRLLFSLMRAARRGVDVRLITPEHSDHPFVDRAKHSYYTLAMKAGVRIYHYQGRVLHAKTSVVDDNWSTIGSANLDNMSLVFNYEVNLVSTNVDFVSEVKEQFVNDLLSSVELEPTRWHKRSIWRKLLELITWPFHGLL